MDPILLLAHVLPLALALACVLFGLLSDVLVPALRPRNRRRHSRIPGLAEHLAHYNHLC